jgi:hypothetical protein
MSAMMLRTARWSSAAGGSPDYSRWEPEPQVQQARFAPAVRCKDRVSRILRERLKRARDLADAGFPRHVAPLSARYLDRADLP